MRSMDLCVKFVSNPARFRVGEIVVQGSTAAGRQAGENSPHVNMFP